MSTSISLLETSAERQTRSVRQPRAAKLRRVPAECLALAEVSSKEIEVDIRAVTGIDSAGRELLAAMHHAGARLIAKVCG